MLGLLGLQPAMMAIPTDGLLKSLFERSRRGEPGLILDFKIGTSPVPGRPFKIFVKVQILRSAKNAGFQFIEHAKSKNQRSGDSQYSSPLSAKASANQSSQLRKSQRLIRRSKIDSLASLRCFGDSLSVITDGNQCRHQIINMNDRKFIARKCRHQVPTQLIDRLKQTKSPSVALSADEQLKSEYGSHTPSPTAHRQVCFSRSC